jgi:hypothetical protein
MTTFSSYVFFVMLDCHFVAMGPICIRFSPYFFVHCLLLFFPLVCVYSFSHLPCPFDGWVPLLDIFIHDFSFFRYSVPGSLQPGASFKAQFTQGVEAKVEPKSSNLRGVTTKNILVPRTLHWDSRPN